MENYTEFELSGTIYSGDKEISIDEINNAFINLVEQKGWMFCGGIRPLDTNVGDIVMCIVTNSSFIKPCEKLTVTEISDRYIKVKGYDIKFNKDMFMKI